MERLLKFRYPYYPKGEIGDDEISVIKDDSYVRFMKQKMDGFYFSKALHIYGLGNDVFHNLHDINNMFSSEYSFLNKNRYCFACDIFGNQFCYSDGKICFFNIETCNEKVLANNFASWIDLILSEHNYYTGESLLLEWEKVLFQILPSQRLVPKKPFAIGGDYSARNMIALDFFKSIEYNASVARQLYNLPDGTPIELNTNPENM